MRLQSLYSSLLTALLMGLAQGPGAIALSPASDRPINPHPDVIAQQTPIPLPPTCRRIGRDNLDVFASQDVVAPTGVRLAINIQISLVLAADGTVIRYTPPGRRERVFFNATIPGLAAPLSGWVEASGLILCAGTPAQPPQTRACARTTQTLAILRSLNNANTAIEVNPDYIGTLPVDTFVEFSGEAQQAPVGGDRLYRRIINPTRAINYDQGGAVVPLPTGTDWWIPITGRTPQVTNVRTVPCT